MGYGGIIFSRIFKIKFNIGTAEFLFKLEKILQGSKDVCKAQKMSARLKRYLQGSKDVCRTRKDVYKMKN